MLGLSSGYADVADGIAAFERDDYETVFRIMHPLAGAGDPVAQAMLGLLYHQGWGCPRVLPTRPSGLCKPPSKGIL